MPRLEEVMPHRWWVLCVTTSAISLVFLNSTILPVALPTIQAELGFSGEGIAWVVNAYLLALVSLLLLGGRLGDLFGLRFIFCTGQLIFIAGSILSAISFYPFWLIGARALLGVGGALLFPPSGVLLISSFPKELRGKAVGINVSVGSIFLISGPILGGLFTQYLSWRYVFWFNIPIALFGIVMALILLPREKPTRGKIDGWGALILALAMGLVVFATMQGDDWGWSHPIIWMLFVAGLCFFGLYYVLWKKNAVSILDLTLFKNSSFRKGNICIFLTQFILMITVYWAIYFQVELNYTPAGAGVLLLFLNIPVLFFAPIGGHLSDKMGPLIPIASGFALILFALLWLTFFAASACFYMLSPALIAFGCGIPMVLSPSFATAMHHIENGVLGGASGTSMAMRQFAATFGLALISALFLTALDLKASYVTAFRLSNLLVAALALVGLLFALSQFESKV